MPNKTRSEKELSFELLNQEQNSNDAKDDIEKSRKTSVKLNFDGKEGRRDIKRRDIRRYQDGKRWKRLFKRHPESEPVAEK